MGLFWIKARLEWKSISTVICKTCNKRVAATNCNTWNLLSHLRVHHSAIHSEVCGAMKAKRPQTRKKSADVTIDNLLSSSHWKELRSMIDKVKNGSKLLCTCKDSLLFILLKKKKVVKDM